MKHILLTAIAILFSNVFNIHYATAQDTFSNAEIFSNKAGQLMEKEFIEVGAMKKLEVKIIRYTDLLSNESISSVRFEYEVVIGSSINKKLASLDADEIDGLIKSIKIMSEKVFISTPENYTEVTFQSRGGFEAGCYWVKDDWSTYLKLNRTDSKSFMFLKKDDFNSFLTLLEKSLTMLGQS